MKRSRLKPGAKSLARGSTFAKPTSSLKRERKAARKKVAKRAAALHGPTDREKSEAWATGKRPCAVCGAAAEHSKGHHIVTQQRLRAVAKQLDLDVERIRWDRRNRLWLCPRHHDAHHSRMKPIGRTVLRQHAPKVFQFARELGLLPWLERTYPEAPDVPADAAHD